MGEPDKAGDQWLSCPIEQGLNRQSSIHCVSDGAKWIASQTDRVFAGQRHFPVDYYHLCEYITDADKECFGKDEKACNLPEMTSLSGLPPAIQIRTEIFLTSRVHPESPGDA